MPAIFILNFIIIIIIIIIIVVVGDCNWVVTQWQWLFYMYTKYEIGIGKCNSKDCCNNLATLRQ